MPNIISPFSLFSILLLNSIPAYATLVLEGRDANGAPSAVCTVSGQAKCTAFYEASLNITILNERVSGSWSSTSAEGSAQANAESIGASSTGLTGWLIPTFEQYALLFYGMGPSDWQYHFGSYVPYWTSEVRQNQPGYAWTFDPTTGTVFKAAKYQVLGYDAIAIRSGDMTSAVPEPSPLALLIVGLLGIAAKLRRKNASTRQRGCGA